MGKTSFQSRLFLQEILLISMVLLIIGGLFLIPLRSELSEDIRDGLAEKSFEAKNSIESMVSTDIKNAKLISENPALKQQLNTLEKTELLNIMLSAYPGYDEITIVDVVKRTALSTSNNYRKDWSGNKYFLDALSGKTAVSDVEKISEGKFAFWILSPVFDAGGDVGSVSIARVPISRIWEITDKQAIGDLGYFFSTDSSGRIIAHKEKALILKDAPYAYDLKSLSLKGSIEFDGYVAGYSRISGTSENPLNWVVFAVQPESEAYGGASSATNSFLIFAASALIFSSVAAFLMSKRISKPIVELRDGIKSTLLGENKYDFSIKTGDEIEEIAVSLKELSGKMDEKEILERLKTDLQAKVKELEKMNKLLVGRETEIAELKQTIEKSKKGLTDEA